MASRFGLGLIVLTALAAVACHPASAADPDSQQAGIEQLRADLAAIQDRLKSLEADVARLSASTASTRESLANDLAQPMLLLVGEGPCPFGFERIKVEAMLLTGPRTIKNTDLIDAAGLADDEQVGVGSRVYRYMDFCFRAAGAIKLQ
jgi:hypothetical protein